MGEPRLEKRRSVRFAPDPGWAASLELRTGKRPALVMDEAKAGCRVVLVASELALAAGDEVTITIGPLPSLRAEVIWMKPQDDLVFVGLRYLE